MKKYFIFLFLLLFIEIFANIGKMELLYNNGDLVKFKSFLDTLKIDTDTDNTVSCKKYYESKIISDTNKLKENYKRIVKFFENTYYGQIALLDLAKLEFFSYDYQKSMFYLEKIKSPKIIDKYFWLAKNFYYQKKYSLAIVNWQKYIELSSDKIKIEKSYLNIAKAYEQKNKWQFAINNLESLRRSEYANNFIPLIDYTLGRYYRKLGNFPKVVKLYQQLMKDYPYHQYSLLAEEELFALEKEENLKIEFNPIINKKDTDFNEIVAKEEVEKVKPKIINNKDKKSDDIKKILLQTGAFSTKSRAINFQKEIFKLGYESIIFSKRRAGRELQVVAVGPFENTKTAKNVQKKLKEKDINSFMIRRR